MSSLTRRSGRHAGGTRPTRHSCRVILLVLPSPAPRRPLAALSSSPIRTGIGSSSALRGTTWITGIQARKQNHPTLVSRSGRPGSVRAPAGAAGDR